MDPIAQIILAVATLVTAIGTLILGLVNRGTLTTVQKQTDGMLVGMQASAEALGHAKGKADEIQYQRDSAANSPLSADGAVKVEITKIPPVEPK